MVDAWRGGESESRDRSSGRAGCPRRKSAGPMLSAVITAVQRAAKVYDLSAEIAKEFTPHANNSDLVGPSLRGRLHEPPRVSSAFLRPGQWRVARFSPSLPATQKKEIPKS